TEHDQWRRRGRHDPGDQLRDAEREDTPGRPGEHPADSASHSRLTCFVSWPRPTCFASWPAWPFRFAGGLLFRLTAGLPVSPHDRLTRFASRLACRFRLSTGSPDSPHGWPAGFASRPAHPIRLTAGLPISPHG